MHAYQMLKTIMHAYVFRKTKIKLIMQVEIHYTNSVLA